MILGKSHLHKSASDLEKDKILLAKSPKKVFKLWAHLVDGRLAICSRVYMMYDRNHYTSDVVPRYFEKFEHLQRHRGW